MTYAADVTCQQAWGELAGSEKSALVDVRTTMEWETIGRPDLSSLGKSAIFAEWQMFPAMQVNPHFAEMVDEALRAAGVGKDDPVYFLCRSGARSQGAASAMTALGYTNACNILAGFEGVPDQSGERGKVNGWQFEKLPWNKE